ncbi:hypothetical protein [Azoarcus sp. KH32C]|uniref:tetratricopeptide repeat protein n=1 Tax=Azoarcus sp. KH32C TaxID=748247 RepID=UPI0002386892|nr:hypothetical protein [Azoarcus sp. KH32C]BAL25890.1 hypothetical protein AZKH_3605 [Azoarcus sp. KH32C]
MRRLSIAGLLTCLLLAATSAATAADAFAPTAAEMRLLPPFCAQKIGGSSSGVGVPAAEQMGRGNWLHIHHYCFAVNFVNRARSSRNAKDRIYNLNLAKGNYGYVIKATQPRFAMRPQIYVELGKVELQLKDVVEGERWFNEALAFNPAYEPAYQALIDLYQELKRNSDALKIATDGLKHVPNSESLQKAYLALGGKKPFPEPVVEKPAPDASGAVAQEVGQGGAEGSAPPSDGTATAADRTPTTTPPPPETGCRFCPPEDVQRRWRGGFKSGKE